jgi:uroporphyrinogen-III synthase
VQFSLSFLVSILPEWPSVKVHKFFILVVHSLIASYMQHYVPLSLQLIAIGPSTAEEIKNAGYPVSATARKPTPEEVVQAIQLCTDIQARCL